MKFKQDHNSIRARIYAHNHRAKKFGCFTDGTLTVASWQEIVLTNPSCALCGSGTAALVIDHIKPLRQGGANSLSNIQAICHPCNTKKDTRPRRPLQLNLSEEQFEFVDEKGGKEYIYSLLHREMTTK